jgi:hypothetical protein
MMLRVTIRFNVSSVRLVTSQCKAISSFSGLSRVPSKTSIGSTSVGCAHETAGLITAQSRIEKNSVFIFMGAKIPRLVWNLYLDEDKL